MRDGVLWLKWFQVGGPWVFFYNLPPDVLGSWSSNFQFLCNMVIFLSKKLTIGWKNINHIFDQVEISWHICNFSILVTKILTILQPGHSFNNYWLMWTSWFVYKLSRHILNMIFSKICSRLQWSLQFNILLLQNLNQGKMVW